ncbi:MAG: AtpZ/AtpI family protein [Planctomycetaceae bacterium]|nr:AtpZ/AtpI family protein [Planctomycetaceae bacterium]
MYWASQVTSISFEVAFFCLLGCWGDQMWETSPWLLLVGSAFGLLVSSWHLWQMLKQLEKESPTRPSGPKG